MTLRAKVFIGSSTEGKEVADAIDFGLQSEAEPTVWTSGAFNLSESIVSGLMRQARESDFGIFVFSGDDTVQIRGRQQRVPRDNVVYELGLFSGFLRPSRCFFVVPEDMPIHLPSDLQGITCARYSTRSDGNWKGAMNPFCSTVKDKIRVEGFRLHETENYLMDLATQYEYSNWITDQATRVSEKDGIFERMRSYIRGRRNDVSKLTLIKQGRLGCYVAFAAAVTVSPEPSDCGLVLSIPPARISTPNAQYKMIAGVSTLNHGFRLSAGNKQELLNWAQKMPNIDKTLIERIEKMRDR
jgi:Predicted nucleotide-binding protein containing TIR-like domain